jgi:hypothetical protein
MALLGATMLVAALAQPSRADTFKSQDGLLELTLPNGWHQAKKGGGENMAIHAAGHGTRIAVREHAKEDYKDIKALSNFLASKMKKKFTDAEPKLDDIQVNGKPAILVDIEGTEPNGVKKGYLITVLEADAMYISITASGNAAAFAKEKQLLGGLANQLKVTAASAPPPASAAPPATAAPPPAASQPPTAAAPTPAKPRASH